MNRKYLPENEKNDILTCFIQILQWRATVSPMLVTLKLLLTELSSNLASTFLAEAWGIWCIKDLFVWRNDEDDDPREEDDEEISAGDCNADIFGPIMGSIRPEILVFFILWYLYRKQEQHQKNYSLKIKENIRFSSTISTATTIHFFTKEN